MTSRTYRLSGLFVRQMQDAARYYQIEATEDYTREAGRKLALEFTEQVEALVEKIVANPLLYAQYHPDTDRCDGVLSASDIFRHAHCHRFPYTIFYSIDQQHIIYFEALYRQGRNYARHLVQDMTMEQCERLGLRLSGSSSNPSSKTIAT